MNDQATSGDSGSAFPSWSPDWATRGLMGSQSVPFQPTPMVAEGSTTEVQMMHISAMPHYQHISGEELRSEIFGLGPSTGPPNSLAGFASNPCASSSSLGLFSWANDASIPTASGWTSSALTSSPFRASPLFSFQPLLPGRTATSINFGGPSLGPFSGSSAFSATGFPKNSSAESAFNQTLNPFASMSLSPQPLASGVSTSLFNFAQPTSSFGDRPLFPSSVSSFPSFSFLQSPSFPRSQPQAPPQASAAGTGTPVSSSPPVPAARHCVEDATDLQPVWLSLDSLPSFEEGCELSADSDVVLAFHKNQSEGKEDSTADDVLLHVHKLLLAKWSPRLKNLLRAEEGSMGKILMEDYCPDGWKLILSQMYPTMVQLSRVNPDLVAEALRQARKYNMDVMVQKLAGCFQGFKPSLDPLHPLYVMKWLSFASTEELKTLKASCVDVVKKNLRIVVRNDMSLGENGYLMKLKKEDIIGFLDAAIQV